MSQRSRHVHGTPEQRDARHRRHARIEAVQRRSAFLGSPKTLADRTGRRDSSRRRLACLIAAALLIPALIATVLLLFDIL